MRLVDGGVTDNLGVRGSMMSPVAQYGNVPDMAGAFTPEQLRRVRHVLVVVANAQVYAPYPWSESGRGPGLTDTLRASSMHRWAFSIMRPRRRQKAAF